MFGLPGGSEWILLVLIVLLLFGSARLPRLARSLREAKDEFKKGSAEPPSSGAGSEKGEKPESAPTQSGESPSSQANHESS
jgi:sec-independent protein translocase protein TatA